jgi:hypothetical protein
VSNIYVHLEDNSRRTVEDYRATNQSATYTERYGVWRGVPCIRVVEHDGEGMRVIAVEDRPDVWEMLNED